jgi:hypothetical protein
MKTGAYSIQEFKPRWAFSRASTLTERLNREFLASKKIGFTLNVCCGTDRSGDLLVDVDKSVGPDVVADLYHLPFRDGAFDTVICDPPFNLFFKGSWIAKVANLARKRLIFSTPPHLPKLGSTWQRSVYFIDSTNSFMRVWQIFTRDTFDLEAA